MDYHHCPTPDCSNVVLCKRVENSNDEVGASSSRICDCFKCGQTSCLTCGARPFHANKTCNEHGEEGRLKNVAEVQLRIQRQLQAGMSMTRPPDQSRAAGTFNINEMRQLHAGMYMPRQPDRSRAEEETHYGFNIDTNLNSGGESNSNNNGDNDDALGNIKRCRRCGNGIEFQSGCLKMKCLCGYRFCYQCGSENAQCDCTPAHHGFTDNKTGRGDMSGLRGTKSYT